MAFSHKELQCPDMSKWRCPINQRMISQLRRIGRIEASNLTVISREPVSHLRHGNFFEGGKLLCRLREKLLPSHFALAEA